MGATVSLIIAALQLAAVVAPYALQGVEALIKEIEAHASTSKLSLEEIEAMAKSHGVDLTHIAGLLPTSTH